MAKMFYTLSEAAQRLGVSEDDVRGLIDSNQLEEFRDGDEMKLKVEQVDLLAGGDADDSVIALADSSELEPIGLSSSGSGSVFGLDDSAEQTGISIFDPEGEEEVDPSAATQVASTAPAMDFASVTASGSGLANIALEPEDTSIGADILEDVYGDDPAASGAPASDSGIGGSSALDTGGDLFEAPVGESDLAPAAPVVAAAALAEPYDGPGSGLVGGVAFGMVITLLLAAAVVVLAMTGGVGAVLSGFSMTYVYAIVGGGLLLMLLGAGVGWFLLRKG